MYPDSLKQELRELVNQLLREDAIDQNKMTCRNIYDLLVETFQFDFEQGQSVKTHYGSALDARSTARALLLPVRNKKYLQTILKVLPSAQRVLYLGCGPFAPLMLFPMLLGYRGVHFNLMDVNAYSLGLLNEMIDFLQLDRNYISVTQADAAVWETDEQYDLVIDGIVDMGMRHEDSFTIHRNIYRQLPQAVYIPKDVHLLLKQEEQITDYDSLAEAMLRGHLRRDCPYPPASRPILQTRILLDDEITLAPDESVITGSTYFYS